MKPLDLNPDPFDFFEHVFIYWRMVSFRLNEIHGLIVDEVMDLEPPLKRILTSGLHTQGALGTVVFRRETHSDNKR